MNSNNAMASNSHEVIFKGQRVLPFPPSTNTPVALNDQALLALPHIGMIVGVDYFLPTKAVYAIYDSSTPGLRFVRGDGTFIIQEQVCFMQSFKDDTKLSNRSQEGHCRELQDRSTRFYQLLKHGARRGIAKMRNQFPTISSVKASLTYISDIGRQDVDCPALSLFDDEDLGSEDEDQTALCVVLGSPPQWDFDPRGFQGRASRDTENELHKMFFDFTKKYGSNISQLDFQHGLFCLAGLEKAGLISFKREGQNDKKHFFNGMTPVLPPKMVLPIETVHGWTVDCFLARFRHFEDIFSENFVHFPNPVLWLEAQLENEERLRGRGADRQLFEPWKGMVNNQHADAVIDWQFLKSIEWKSRDFSMRYPKPLSYLRLVLDDTHKSNEPKSCKKNRKGKESSLEINHNSLNGHGPVAPIDLTGDSPQGHMNRLPVAKPWERSIYDNDAVMSDYTGDESELPTPVKHRRRKSSVYSTNETIPWVSQNAQNSRHDLKPSFQGQKNDSKQAVKREFIDDDEQIFRIHDSEPGRIDRLRLQKRSRRDSPSPTRLFKVPPKIPNSPQNLRAPIEIGDLLSSENSRIATKNDKLIAKAASKLKLGGPQPLYSEASKDMPFGDGYNFGHIKNPSINSTDSDDINGTENPVYRPPPMSRKKQSSTSKQTSVQSNDRKSFKSTKLLGEACDDFEKQHKLDGSDPRILAKLRSPSKESENSFKTSVTLQEISQNHELERQKSVFKAESPPLTRTMTTVETPQTEAGTVITPTKSEGLQDGGRNQSIASKTLAAGRHSEISIQHSTIKRAPLSSSASHNDQQTSRAEASMKKKPSVTASRINSSTPTGSDRAPHNHTPRRPGTPFSYYSGNKTSSLFAARNEPDHLQPSIEGADNYSLFIPGDYEESAESAE